MVHPFQKGDLVQLKGPTNPYKGNIRMGKSYAIKGVGYRDILLRADNGSGGYFNSEHFTIYEAPTKMDDDEYNQIIAAQDSLDLAKING